MEPINKKGDIVKVTGDRGVGSYLVKLGERREDLEVDEFDIIHHATILKSDDNAYDLEMGSEVFVYQDTDEEYFGAIDPFISEDDANNL